LQEKRTRRGGQDGGGELQERKDVEKEEKHDRKTKDVEQ
jgi:hypothetical protein